MLYEYQGIEDRRVEDAAATVLLLRGTGVACAGMLAGATLFAEGDGGRYSALPALRWGVLVSLLSVSTLRSPREYRAWQLSLIAATPLVLAWVALVLALAWRSRDDPLWLVLLSPLLLPDVYALWTILRGRGRLFVAHAMVVLAALSSLLVSWLGAALLLA